MSQVNNNGGWSENVVLTVLAWDEAAESALPSNTTVAGLTNVQLVNNNDVEVFNITIAEGCTKILCLFSHTDLV